MSARTYTREEKQAYINEYKVSQKSKQAYAKEKGIPASTLRSWLKDESAEGFGIIDVATKMSMTQVAKQNSNALCYASENIKIEIKEGYDKELLKKIVEVLVHDQ